MIKPIIISLAIALILFIGLVLVYEINKLDVALSTPIVNVDDKVSKKEDSQSGEN